MNAYVGQPLPRLEDPRFLTGAARYTADLDLPGQAYAVVLRSPHAHAEIAGIELAAARRAPGVLGVYASADLQAAGIKAIPSLTRTPPFQLDERRRQRDGGRLAISARARAGALRRRAGGAGGRRDARRGARCGRAGRGRLPAAAGGDRGRGGARRGRARCSGRSSPPTARSGGRRAIRRRSPRACRRPPTWSSSRSTTRARSWPSWSRAPRSRATTRRAGRYTLRVGTQSAHQLRAMLARVLDLGEERIRVIVPEVGGGFGARNGVYPEFVLALFAARALGRPVKWVARAQRELRRRLPGPQPAPARRRSASMPSGRFIGARRRRALAPWRLSHQPLGVRDRELDGADGLRALPHPGASLHARGRVHQHRRRSRPIAASRAPS